MIYLYGDSHAHFSFKGLKLEHKDYHSSGITMFRIGRDGVIINFKKALITSEHDIIVLAYGEVDCRCHIQRQINNGRDEDEIINDLVNNYYRTIKTNIVKKCKIIIVGVIPPTKQSDYESIHGPILHEFPFVGTDEDRVRYTNKVNKQLEEYAGINNYIYFNSYDYYTREDGTLNHTLSDKSVHLGDNMYFKQKFCELFL
jgi:hypothetical protein